MSTARTQLLEVFKSRAFSFGDFTLASGKKSSYYVNSKKAIFNGEVVNLLSEVLWEMTKDLNIDAAGGLEVGAIPMAAVLAQRFAMHGKPLEGFFVRKQAKEHGAKERVEGVLKPGMRVAVLDDVLTTGGSVRASDRGDREGRRRSSSPSCASSIAWKACARRSRSTRFYLSSRSAISGSRNSADDGKRQSLTRERRLLQSSLTRQALTFPA